MPDKETYGIPQMPDVDRLSERWTETSAKSLSLLQDFYSNIDITQGASGGFDESSIRAFQDFFANIATNPEKLAEAQINLWNGMIRTWSASASKMMGLNVEDPIAPAIGDRRFNAEEWEENVAFDYIKQSYLVVSDFVQDLTNSAEGMDAQNERKIRFLSRQFVSAISPSNFAHTNPKVLKETVQSGGENLVSGLNNLLGDLERGHGQLKISMTDETAFEVGVNVATTPGKVVFRNDLFELIQYAPTTDKVHATPMLFVPPWINKFYILDLKPENSLIKWVLDQGHTLFVISWVNPDEALSDIGFSDYMTTGLLPAMDTVTEITGEARLNILGFCIGGILTTTTLAYLAAKGDNRVNSATLLATMIDLSDAGEMSVFVDADQIDTIAQKVEDRGFLEGREMAEMFNMMRENDLIWSFVVSNYLMGKEPVPFDLLYWNSDSTRMPAKMIVEYLSHFYRDNAFVANDKLQIDGTTIDVGKILTPAYLLATKEDHIAPWKACYEGVNAFGGDVRFVLGGSGHIAGIVNPPHKNKYGHWINPGTSNEADPDVWFSGAEPFDGSWWTDWGSWLKPRSGKSIAARHPGDNGRKTLKDAPGEYVRLRAN